jgi:hypothetical protein
MYSNHGCIRFESRSGYGYPEAIRGFPQSESDTWIVASGRPLPFPSKSLLTIHRIRIYTASAAETASLNNLSQ